MAAIFKSSLQNLSPLLTSLKVESLAKPKTGHKFFVNTTKPKTKVSTLSLSPIVNTGPDLLCWLSSPVAEATDGGLKCFVGVNENVSGLEGSPCWLSTTKKEVGCPLDCCCCLLLATWLC